MHRLFLQLSLWLTIGTLVICGLVYIALNRATTHREDRYFEQILTLPMQLLSEGVGRHADQPEQQQQWLTSAGRILGAELSLQTLTDPRNGVKIERTQQGLRVTTKLASQQVLQLRVAGWGEPQWRATLFLVLNELGRYPRELQSPTLARLAERSPYDLRVIERGQAALEPRYQLQLQQGQTVMELRQQPGQSPALQFFAPFGDTDYLLALGPVPVFEPYPYQVLLMIGGAAAVLSMLLAVLMIRPLVRQLRAIESELDQINPGHLQTDLSFAKKTPFDQLANKISRMTARIDALIRLQEDTVGAISHDLRTPIARLRLRSEMIRRHLPSEQQHRAAAMDEDLGDLHRLADEVVHYISLHREHQREQDRAEAVEVLRRLLDDTQQVHPNLAWHVSLPNLSMPVALSRSLIHRLGDNLIGNAIRYAASQVAVTTHQQGDQLVLSVDDDGPGVPESQRSQVFEPFWRPDDARQRTTGGHGLGLAIVKRIVARAGGSVRIEDSPLGGARFVVSLPLATDDLPTTSTIQRENN